MSNWSCFCYCLRDKMLCLGCKQQVFLCIKGVGYIESQSILTYYEIESQSCVCMTSVFTEF